MPLHWARALKRKVPDALTQLNALVEWAEAFVLVTPECPSLPCCRCQKQGR